MRKGLMALSVLLMSFVAVFFVLTACEYEPTGVEEPPIVVPEPSADYELNEDEFDLEDDLSELDEDELDGDELSENEPDEVDAADESDDQAAATDSDAVSFSNVATNNSNNVNNNTTATPPAVTVPPVTPPVVNRPPATPPVAPPPPAPVCRDVWVETSPAIPAIPDRFERDPNDVCYQVMIVMPNGTEFTDVSAMEAYMVANNQTSFTTIHRCPPATFIPGTPAIPAKGHWVQQCN